jgi:4-amino-4-deoxy-L-arabinose transferase-like glycosyltransferase
MSLAPSPAAVRTLPPALRRGVAPHRLALAGILALSATLNLHRLSQNGYANIFYSAGVRSMLRSWHNFLFAAADPGGLMSIDKPPLGLWAQAASARLFGFSPLALLLPEALAGVLAVAALYWATVRPFGRPVALAGALALAVFPSFVAVSRDNNLDALLILLMVLACGLALRAIESGRWRPLLGCAVLVGLAFNTKALAAYLIVPGIGIGYLLCAPGPLSRRLARLAVGGALMAAVSFSWIALVELTPASQRPYVGGSLDNTELGLTFEYNGFGRVGGQVGGPRPAAATPARPSARSSARSTVAPPHTRTPPRTRTPLHDGRMVHPVSFGGPTGPLRLFDSELGDQDAWFLPLSLVGLLALGLSLLATRAPVPDRRAARLAGLLVLGGWLLTEAVVLSLSNGIVHPYYVSALGPGAAAMLGAGGAAILDLTARGGGRERPAALGGLALVCTAVAATVLVQIVLLDRAHYMHWFLPLLVAGAALGVAAFFVLPRVVAATLAPRLATPALALTLGVLLIAPLAYARTTWLAPVEGTFPVAGPRQDAGYGGFDVNPVTVTLDRGLIAYLQAHGATRRWGVLTQASDTAAPMILLGFDAGALGGYSATDPALDGPGLARLVAKGEARYVVLGGAYTTRGGNPASAAVALACAPVPDRAWGQTQHSRTALVLYDCAGRERALAGA